MQIHQFLTSFSYGDAIGNEAVEIRDYLRSQDIQSEIFALFYHPRYADQIINYREYDRHSHPDNVAIFHFSIGSPVTRKFLSVPDKKVIIYHNITPYHFFLDYHRILAKDCFKGRIELRKIRDRVDLALGDSEYNEKELREAGFPRTGVLPLVMNFKKFDRPLVPVIEQLFRDGKTNLLYVGRIIPNKKVEDILKVYHCYKRWFNPGARLIIVGESRGFERYRTALDRLISDLEIKDVFFTGHVPDEELISYFKLADIYLHMSEHEGFCAPVPEAFYLEKPVIAYDAGAVGETMKGGGMLVRRKSFIKIAGLIDQVVQNEDLRKEIIRHQNEQVTRYFQSRTGEILLKHLRESL